MRIISIANQKGGCGKTTTAINLSACLSFNGRRVLLIDLDPQGHSTIGLSAGPDSFDKTVYDVLGNLEGGKTTLDDVVCQVTENFYLCPANLGLSTFEQQHFMVQGREAKLKKAIDALYQVYDYVTIDCPPSLGLLTFNALFASTEVFIPVEMGLFSLHGTGKLMEIIDLVRNKTGHEIDLKVIATMVDRRTRIAREVLSEIENHFKGSMFHTVINLNVKLKEAAGFGKSIVDYARKSTGYTDYMALATEVLDQEKIPEVLPSEIELEESLQPRKITKVFSYYSPRAESVKLVGDFNQWAEDQAFVMQRDDEGIWSKEIPLKPGTYEYKFVVNDNWVLDQTNPNTVESSFGVHNSVIEVN
jgi:chromosome partitioning protein